MRQIQECCHRRVATQRLPLHQRYRQLELDRYLPDRLSIGLQVAREQAHVPGPKTIIDKTASYTPTLGESGALYTNDGAGAAITFTLPSPSIGQVYGFVAQDDQDIFIVPASGDQILSETNAADDHLGQATQYGVIWIVSDGTDWLPVSVIGTWDDEDG